MKRGERIASIIAVILALMLPISGCQRLSRQTGKDVDPTPTPSSNTVTKKEVGYLVPFSYNQGFVPAYGYMDSDGRTVIKPRFKDAYPFYECDLAVVLESNDRYGLIDKSGNYVVQPEYDYISYSEGLFIGTNYEKGGSEVFDQKGQKLFSADAYFYQYNEGLTGLYKKGYMDTKGQVVIPMTDYELLTEFLNGYALVSKDYMGASFYIDKMGNDATDKVSSGLRMFKDETSECYGFTNAQGEVVIEAMFVDAQPFMGGYAIVRPTSEQGNKEFGIIDTSGEFVLPPVYCGIVRLSNGLVAVGQEVNPDDYVPEMYFDYSKKALFTPDLGMQTDWIYYLTENFDENYICVNDDKSVFFIDTDLNEASDMPNLKGFGSFTKDGNLLRGDYNSYLSVVDKKGKILTKGNEWIDLGDGIKVHKLIESPLRTTTMEYPVLSGLDDKSVQDRLNQFLYEEMVGSYEYSDSGEDIYISTFESYFTMTRQKDLLLIDQYIYTYSLGAAHGLSYRNTVYLDVRQGELYSLDDLFKEGSGAYDYLSKAVSDQMVETMDEVGYWEDHVTITPNTGYVIGKDGLILYFGQYEIASYAAGMPEFLIPYSDLMNYIDTEGGFWKSFN